MPYRPTSASAHNPFPDEIEFSSTFSQSSPTAEQEPLIMEDEKQVVGAGPFSWLPATEAPPRSWAVDRDTDRDISDMLRLGKKQEFKVFRSARWAVCFETDVWGS